MPGFGLTAKKKTTAKPSVSSGAGLTVSPGSKITSQQIVQGLKSTPNPGISIPAINKAVQSGGLKLNNVTAPFIVAGGTGIGTAPTVSIPSSGRPGLTSSSKATSKPVPASAIGTQPASTPTSTTSSRTSSTSSVGTGGGSTGSTGGYAGIVGSNNAGLVGGMQDYTLDQNNQFVYQPAENTGQQPAQDKSYEDIFKGYLGMKEAPPNTANILRQEERAAGIQQKQQEVSNYANQLNQINAKAQADILSVTGQGRGIPEAIIGGQQAQIEKEAAIRALPVQASLAAAQGNLQMAQEHVDQMFKIRSEDVQARYQYENDYIDSLMEFASKGEERRLSDMKEQRSQQFQTQQNQLNYAQTLASTAISNGQSGVAAKIMALDPRSPTYQRDVAKYAAQINIAQAGAGGSAGSAGSSGIGSGSAQTAQLASTKSNVDLITDLVDDSYLKTAVGPNTLARTSFTNVFTGGKSNFISGVEQLRSQLNINTLIQAKGQGATFGALSDQELRVLASAATKIGTWAIKDSAGNITGYNVGEKDFKKELDKIGNFAKLDFIQKGGDPAEVKAQVMPDGTIWVTNSDGTFTQLK